MHGLTKRTFSPPWPVTVGALLLCALFIRLGFWQWDRGNMRQAQWNHFARGADKAVALGSAAVDTVPRFQRVSLEGRYDGTHQFLLDNRTHDGRVGYEVLTPFDRPDGRVVLVDRGWVPFTGRRDTLPDIALDPHGGTTGATRRESREAPAVRRGTTITGRADDLPSAGLAYGRAAPAVTREWPKVTSYPTMTELSAALAQPLDARIVLLDPQEPEGYVRDWHPPGIQPVRHWSYAVQWWCFAVVTVIFWFVIARRLGPARPTRPEASR